MKAFIAGVITLSVLTVCITVASIFITGRTDRLLSVIDSLPESVSKADSYALSAIWDQSRTLFSLSVHRKDVDNIDDTIEKMKIYIKEGNETGYLVTLTELRCLMERLKKAESFSPERIF